MVDSSPQSVELDHNARDGRLDWLQWCCARGMRLIPCWHIDATTGICACGKGVMCGKDAGKHPHVDDWRNTASSDLGQVTAWHQQWPDANWAWVLDHHFVLDVDPRNGGPTEDQLDTAWEQLFGFTLPTTLTQLTGGGGLHLVYEQNGTQAVHNGRLWLRDKKVPGIDVKGVGGYIMVCPSNHKSGRWYEWRNPGQPIVSAPPELYGLLRRSTTTPSDGEVDQDHESLDLDHWLQEGPNVECGGQREHLLRGIGWMRQRFYTRLSAIGLASQVAMNYVNCRPDDPWTTEYVIKLVDDIWGRYPAGEQPEPWMTELTQRIAAGGSTTLPPEVQTALTQATQRVWVNRQAERSIDAYEAALARGERKKLTARQFAQEPKPTPVLRNELVIGPNGLAGPSEAGKSLQVRDWLLEIAESGRKVLAVLSEGTHDFEARWASHPRYERAADNIYVLDEPVDLVHGDDVDWLLAEYADVDGVVAFDVIYDMGMADDNGVKDVMPIFASLKRISSTLGVATIAVGHPGLNGERRFRGSSMWRQLFLTEYHMTEGLLTCEKSKLTDKRTLARSYRIEYPTIEWRSPMEHVADEAARRELIERDLVERPEDSDRARALRLLPLLGLRERRLRDLIKEVRETPRTS
jgi:Bifunctional DNA primase/polymerase, N-terminal/AAA domain